LKRLILTAGVDLREPIGKAKVARGCGLGTHLSKSLFAVEGVEEVVVE
jgi:hypothetical protein